MKTFSLRRASCTAAAACMVGLLSFGFGIHAYAAEAVTVDFVHDTYLTHHGGDKKPDQSGYLYYNGGVDGYIEFAIPKIEPGDYTAAIVYKTHDECGVFQTYIDGTAVGDPVDQHADNSGDITKELGTVTIQESDTHTVRLEEQENSYGKYRITVKSLTLTPG